MKHVMEKLEEVGLLNFYFYKLDDFSVIIYKCDEHANNSVLTQEEKVKLKECFHHSSRWIKNYKLQFRRSLN